MAIEANLPPRPALLDVVGAVEGADDRDQCRRAAPQSSGHAKCEQSAVLVVGQSPHLFLNQCEELRRNKGAECPPDVIRDVGEGKETGQRKEKDERGKERQKQVVGELGRESQHIVVERLAPGAAAKLDP